jgi:phosphoribosylformylglycinamidine synthase
VYFQLREVTRGMAEACNALGTPVTGGNVSLYNENPTGAVYPTPVIGMVGLIESIDHITRSHFQVERDAIVLLGEPTPELGASEYLARVHGVVAGQPPACDLDAERSLIDALLEAIQRGVIRSAHDCSDGGLAVALAECCIMNREEQHGARIDLSHWRELPVRALLFGEAQGRVVVSTSMPDTVASIAQKHGVPARVIGHVGSASDAVQITTAGGRIAASLARLDEAYHETLPRIMSTPIGTSIQ